MKLIENTEDLKAFCAQGFGDFITIDTEFLRDKTYYPLLCLVQIGARGIEPAAIDPLAKGVKLDPLIKLLKDKMITKVFHAAKQDMEIFYEIMNGKLPEPIFDTQVAASVLGYGEQVAYHALVKKICNEDLDKSRQYTDWSHRPLSDAQVKYAIGDVTHLIDIYESLTKQLKQKKRLDWTKEDMKVLNEPRTYANDPFEAYKRIKIRSQKKADYVVLQELAAWREKEAQRHNIPKQRMMKDEILTQLALVKPDKEESLERVRGLPAAFKKEEKAKKLLKLVKTGVKNIEKSDLKPPKGKPQYQQDISAAVDMLKLLLKINANEHGIAARMVASAKDLEAFALGDHDDLPMLNGWRYDIFGKEAEKLLKGKLTLGLRKGNIHKV